MMMVPLGPRGACEFPVSAPKETLSPGEVAPEGEPARRNQEAEGPGDAETFLGICTSRYFKARVPAVSLALVWHLG